MTRQKTDTDLFSCWLRQTTKLSDTSIYKYSKAVGVISREMMECGVIIKSLRSMDALELDIAINDIIKNQQFIDKNKRGNNMYSNALKQYRYYTHSEGNKLVLVDEDTYIKYIQQGEISETECRAIALARIGQGAFRKSLFEKYNGRCVITGINHPSLLVASHIKPWAVSSNLERLCVDNGLLLSATYDKLFDSGLITFDTHGRIHLSSLIGKENISRLNLSDGVSFELNISHSMKVFLEYHNEVLFLK